MKTDNTEEQQKPWLFKPGQSGNPEGRPKGTRNVFAQDFVRDFAAHWAIHGVSVLDDLVKEDKAAYARIAVSILPKIIGPNEDTGDAIEEPLSQMIPFDAIRARVLALDENTRAEEVLNKARKLP